MTQLSRIGLEQFRTTILSTQNQHYQNSKLRFISPDKWKNLMIKSLDLISQYNYSDLDLIHDLKVIVNNITEDKFIQAILSFQPFKPKFKSTKFLDLDSTSTTIKQLLSVNGLQCRYQTPKTKLKKDQSIIQKGSLILKKKNCLKNSPNTCESLKSNKFSVGFIEINQKDSFLQEYLQVIIEQEALKKQFEKKYHPFKIIIESFTFILENKFKNIIDSIKNIKLEKIQQKIQYDILVLQKLFIKISQPYQNIFHSEKNDEVKIFKIKIQLFIKDYLHSHQKINTAIRKIMRHYSKNSKIIKKLQSSIQDFVEITHFQIPPDFQIDGCYVQSMNTLMELTQITSPFKVLKKLQQFRMTIAKDVDFYYESFNQNKQRQINAQVQIEIIRFIVCKLKGWIPEIYAQLKFLQIVYGDEEIAYKYDDSSYIYAQLITVFDALEVESLSESSNCDSKETQSA